MKTLRIVVRNGTMDTSPIIDQWQFPVPDSVDNFSWSRFWKKGIWFVTLAIRLDITIS